MFYDPEFDPAKTKAWQEHVSWGHVVIFRFPIRLPGENETAKARPCVILETLTIGIERYAVVAYGTSAGSNANRGYDIDARGTEAAAAGLNRDTRFVGVRRITVSLDHAGFVHVGRSTPRSSAGSRARPSGE